MNITPHSGSGHKVCARPLTRRDFLKGALAFAPALYVAPHVVMRGAFGSAATPGKNILLVEMFGGNDGFNTIVPFGVNSGTYYTEFRKNISIPENTLIKINSEIGFSPALASLVNGAAAGAASWNTQKLAVIQGVSYPNASFSHETAAGIWAKGDPSASQSQGWLARVLAKLPPAAFPYGADIQDRVSPVFLNSTQLVPSIESLDDFSFPGDPYFPSDAQFRRASYQTIVNNLKSATGKTAAIADTCANAQSLIDAFGAITPAAPTVPYPEDSLSDALQLAITLLKSNLGFRFIHLGIGGFDTHSNQNQNNYHQDLLKTVSDALAAAQADLAAHGLAQDTIAILYSEFGRAVYDNGSNGCDHGTVEPVLVLGAPVTGGIYNSHPVLDPGALAPDGEPVMTTDFRDVFGTVVNKWLQLDPTPIFPGYAVNPLGFLP